MQTLLQFHADKVTVFALVFARVAALVIVAPMFASRTLPLNFRLLLALCLALLIAPLQLQFQPAPVDLPEFAVAVGSESLIGLSLGLSVVILMGAVELAGRLISQVAGLSMTDMVGGEMSGPAPVPAHLLYWVAMGVFVATGGHRIVVTALLDTFQSLPPGSVVSSTALTETTTHLLSESFQLGLRAAAPVLMALFVATIATGLVSRAVPHWNHFTLGFGINIFVVLAAMFLSLGGIAFLISDNVESFLQAWSVQ